MSYDDIVVVIGPAGSGKNTLISKILPRLPQYRLARSATTRAFRPSDDPGGTGFKSKYIYTTPEWFQEIICRDAFLEYNDEYAGNAYGTLQPASTFRPLLEIDIVGARQVRDRYPQTRIVFVTVPGSTISDQLAELRRRIVARAQASGEELDQSNLNQRLVRAEMELVESLKLADCIITNEDVERSAGTLLSYIQSQ